jgi:hypothetical protein
MATLAVELRVEEVRERGAVAGFLARLVQRKPLGAFGAVVFLVFLLCGIFAGALAPHGMNEISPINRMKAPSLEFPFGTDNLGRDMPPGALRARLGHRLAPRASPPSVRAHRRHLAISVAASTCPCNAVDA